jgi:hypothetical protein
MPMWTRGGTELVYVSAGKRVMAVPFMPESHGAQAASARPLFAIDDVVDLDPVVIPTLNAYAALPSGDRFLVATRSSDPEAPPIHVALVDWKATRRR